MTLLHLAAAHRCTRPGHLQHIVTPGRSTCRHTRLVHLQVTTHRYAWLEHTQTHQTSSLTPRRNTWQQTRTHKTSTLTPCHYTCQEHTQTHQTSAPTTRRYTWQHMDMPDQHTYTTSLHMAAAHTDTPVREPCSKHAIVFSPMCLSRDKTKYSAVGGSPFRNT